MKKPEIQAGAVYALGKDLVKVLSMPGGYKCEIKYLTGKKKGTTAEVEIRRLNWAARPA